jgi:cbb3-type cytochrome oxidase maturation protein
MTALLILIPVALLLGSLGLAAFLWSMRAGQFDDLDGAAARILYDEQLCRVPQQATALRSSPSLLDNTEG